MSLLLLLALSAPSVRAVAAQGDSTLLRVQLRGAKSQVIERATAAFLSGGLPIAQADAGTLTSVPQVFTSGFLEQKQEVTYRATVLAVNDSEAVVVLSGTKHCSGCDEGFSAGAGARRESPPQPLTSRDNWKRQRQGWRRLEEIAAALAASAP